ncbi:MAG: D-aminoacylase [Verrucomicrobia bacterium]|nr:D-aminoacylase [Verrucomicrobiota bacterium]MDA1086390.1 D-aminoacylase [Verrucomicrobiota bacterium]
MLDLKIIGGMLFDGLGTEGRRADVGIKHDRIADVGDLSAAEAGATIDASGQYVCPGFIDAHSHSDTYLIIEPSAHSKIYQGITTEVVGNCGASGAPLHGEYRMPSDWGDKTYPGPWCTVAEYREQLEAAQPGPNTYLLIGHNTLRAGSMGYDDRRATPDELELMKKRLRQSLEEGGRGLSTGLVYLPGLFAPPEEVIELARILAEFDGIYTSHMRSESSRLLEAIDETVAVGREAGCRVQVSHLKATGRENWHLVDAAIERIRSARDAGMEVASDRYPYTASNTDLDVIFPSWVFDGGRDAAIAHLRSASGRSRIRETLLKERDEDYWGTITIGSTSHPDNADFKGKPLLEVARRLDLEPVDAALYLTDSDELKTGAFFFGMSEENMWKILAEPYVMFGSDASLRAPCGPLSHDHPHPRAYGSMVKFLRAALDGRTVGFSEAVRKSTSLPAGQFRMKDRGILEAGKMADVVVLEPASLNDRSDYEQPHQLSEGIQHVIVNGVPTLSKGELTGRRAGRML